VLTGTDNNKIILGVEQDYEKALEYFRLASKMGVGGEL
jgi:TPR repeat protein